LIQHTEPVKSFRSHVIDIYIYILQKKGTVTDID